MNEVIKKKNETKEKKDNKENIANLRVAAKEIAKMMKEMGWVKE